jgi:hypothetical protein
MHGGVGAKATIGMKISQAFLQRSTPARCASARGLCFSTAYAFKRIPSWWSF